jgi:hypothetical protein
MSDALRSWQKPRFLPAAERDVRKMAAGHFSNGPKENPV